MTFRNTRPDSVDLIWIGPDGSQKNYSTLKTNESFRIRTRPGTAWLVRTAPESPLGYFVVENKPDKTAQGGVIPPPTDPARK